MEHLLTPYDFLAGLLDAGFSRDIALGNALAYTIEYCEVEATAKLRGIPHRLTLMAQALVLVGEAARECGIDRKAIEAEIQRQNEELAYIRR